MRTDGEIHKRVTGMMLYAQFVNDKAIIKHEADKFIEWLHAKPLEPTHRCFTTWGEYEQWKKEKGYEK